MSLLRAPVRRLRPLLFALACLTAAGSAAASYLVGPGDVLQVNIRGGGGSEGDNADLELQVAGDGSVDVAYVGRVTVSGKATPEIQAEILEKLRKKQIFAAPSVSVNVTEYGSQPVNVAGAVREPMRIFMKGPMRLSDALADAKGLEDEVVGERIRIQRRDQSEPVIVRIDQLYGFDRESTQAANVELRPFDDVWVERKARFCVSGPVESPGCYDFESNSTVLTALALAGGLDEELADRSSLTIWRGGDDSKLVVDLTEIETGEQRPPELRAGDHVMAAIKLNVTVNGSVCEPGLVDYYDGITISDAIAEAKGVECADVFGSLKKVLLRRGGQTREVNVKQILEGSEADVSLKPGDKVFVPAKRLGW